MGEGWGEGAPPSPSSPPTRGGEMGLFISPSNFQEMIRYVTGY